MKIEFSTLNILGFVAAYFLLFLFAGLLHYLVDFNPEYIYGIFLFVPPFYFLLRGRIKLRLTEEYLYIEWLKKPVLGRYPNRKIHFNEVLRWKYVNGYRGPDTLVFILECGEKLKFRPSIFTWKDIESEFLKEFGARIA